MATEIKFNGKNYVEPGAYAATTYNPTSVSNVAEFGKVMIIDTGLSMNGTYEFTGGSGINGELNQGIKSVYEFEKYQDFLSFIGGGQVGDIVKNIFSPITTALGAPKVYYVRAATTKSATIDLELAAEINFSLKCKNEGVVGNGVKVNSILKVGYSASLIAGDTADTFKLQIFKGTFKGVDADGEPYGIYPIERALPELIAESPELTTLLELFNWASTNKAVLNHFIVSKSGADSTPLKVVAETLATGGTTSFLSANEYDDVLEAIQELDITFFLTTNLNASDGKGVDVNSNVKLFTFLKNSAKFTEFMVVPGGEDNTDLFGSSNTSESIAKFYDSGQVVVVHGAPEVLRKDGNGVKKLPTIYLAASIVGLNAGMAPQTPLTFKKVGYQSFVYPLKEKERVKALQAGIMHVRNVSGTWRINQGITTLLDNKRTIADDGQSLELSIELIKAQLNKELILEGQERFTGNNVAQASPESVKNFTETKLISLVAYPGNDNLLIDWKNVNVTARNGDYFITYDFVPNVPVNKTFFIGNILDFQVNV